MPALSLVSITQHNLIVTSTPPQKRTKHPNDVKNNDNPVSTRFIHSSNPSLSPTLIPTSSSHNIISSRISGGAKTGLIVGLTVGLVLVVVLLTFLILRRKYGPNALELLYARVFTRNRSEEEQRNKEPGPATRGNETHQTWHRDETSSRHSEENSKTVLGNLWGYLKRLFVSSESDTHDTSTDQNAIPLENQYQRNSSMRSALQPWSTGRSSFHTSPDTTPSGSPAIIPQPRENSSMATIPSYYIQYRNQFLSPPESPQSLSMSYRTDTTSTRESDQSRIRNIGSWAHYQKQRQQRQRKSKPPSIETINEHNTIGNSHASPSANRKSTRAKKNKHRRSSASTLSVFRQHPGEELDIGLSSPKRRRIRSSVLNRLMPN